MPQIFYVHCPACNGRFPCHMELWQVEAELLCPFCQHSFPQDESPLIITATGEPRRRGAAPTPAAEVDPTTTAEAM